MRATATKVVPLSLERTWAVVSDHEGMRHWAPGLTVELIAEGAPERNGVGAVRRISAPGPLPAVVEEIDDFRAGALLGYRALSGIPFRDYRATIALREVPGGTQVTWTATAHRRLPIVERVVLHAFVSVLMRLLARRLRGEGQGA